MSMQAVRSTTPGASPAARVASDADTARVLVLHKHDASVGGAR